MEGGEEVEVGRPSKVGKPCQERAKADKGSGAGRGRKVGVSRPRKSRPSKVGK